EVSFSSRAVWLDQAAVLRKERSSMEYARISLNNSSPFLTLRHRSTAPLALAKSLKSAGRNWHRYFQSVPIKFLSMPEAYISRNKCQWLILAPMALSALLQHVSQGRFPRFSCHFRRRLDPGARTRRA